MFPVYPCNFSRAKSTREDGQAHPDFFVPPVLGLGVYIREDRGVRTDFDAIRKSLTTDCISLDIKMGIIDRVILVSTCGYLTERTGIKNLSAPER